jgi:hypothetical protein
MMKPTYLELEFQVTSQRMALEAAAKKLGQLVENFGAGMVFEELIEASEVQTQIGAALNTPISGPTLMERAAHLLLLWHHAPSWDAISPKQAKDIDEVLNYIIDSTRSQLINNVCSFIQNEFERDSGQSWRDQLVADIKTLAKSL